MPETTPSLVATDQRLAEALGFVGILVPYESCVEVGDLRVGEVSRDFKVSGVSDAHEEFHVTAIYTSARQLLYASASRLCRGADCRPDDIRLVYTAENGVISEHTAESPIPQEVSARGDDTYPGAVVSLRGVLWLMLRDEGE